MSHTTSLDEIVFTDTVALRAAVTELQGKGVRCSLVENVKPRAFFQNQDGMSDPAPFVLRLDDGPYDVGFYFDEAKKGFVPRMDLWQGHISKALGAPTQGKETAGQGAIGRLYNAYAVHAATRAAARQGYNVRRVNKDNGAVQLVITLPN